MMREQLLGYLLNALEPTEHEEVEAHLGKAPPDHPDSPHHVLRLLHRAIEPLKCDKDGHEPPQGLASRTCSMIFEQTTVRLAVNAADLAPRGALPGEVAAPSPRRWTIADMVVAAGIMVAAAMLFFPAMMHSRNLSRLTNCENNLRDLGVSLTNYSNRHEGYFPKVPLEGNGSVAGVYAATLKSAGLLDKDRSVLCPSSPLVDEHFAGDASKFHVPTLDELGKADGKKLADYQRTMGGSYGYTMGYLDSSGHYQPTKNLSRSSFALMSDAVSPNSGKHQSDNHGGNGQNVLFEDGHLQYMTAPHADGSLDDVYVNDAGQVAAGTHADDAVVATSASKPVIWPVHGDQPRQPAE